MPPALAHRNSPAAHYRQRISAMGVDLPSEVFLPLNATDWRRVDGNSAATIISGAANKVGTLDNSGRGAGNSTPATWGYGTRDPIDIGTYADPVITNLGTNGRLLLGRNIQQTARWVGTALPDDLPPTANGWHIDLSRGANVDSGGSYRMTLDMHLVIDGAVVNVATLVNRSSVAFGNRRVSISPSVLTHKPTHLLFRGHNPLTGDTNYAVISDHSDHRGKGIRIIPQESGGASGQDSGDRLQIGGDTLNLYGDELRLVA